MDGPNPYPSAWESHVVLKDGSTVELRPIRAEDRDAIDRFHRRQSQQSIYFRFFRYRPELSDKELDYFTQVDYENRMAFVALVGHELVAVARYERWSDRPAAEVAFFVDDAHHGKGLATVMLEYLAAAAREQGLSGFTASVLPENYGMLAVFRSAGFQTKTRFADGVIEVDLGIEVTPEASTAIADRQRKSTARSVARILEPRNVAVVGASRFAGNVGYEMVRNLVAGAGGPRVFPVNPHVDEVAGLPAYPTILAASLVAAEQTDPDDAEESEGDSEGVIDLAVITVRAELVAKIVEQCAAVGVRGLLVISTGFSERGAEGQALQDQLVDLARDNGMRVIGPGSFGLINSDPEVDLRALFHPVRVLPGAVGVVSESGPLGAAVLERMRSAEIGISTFVGIGTRADVSVNDLLDYWNLDPRTKAGLLYVESYGNLRNFSTVARRTSMSKPVITVAPSDPDLKELLRQSGVILVDEVPQLVDQSWLAVTQPMAKGNRVVIVSNTASLARLAARACRRNGLEVVVPSTAVSDSDLERDGSQQAVLIGDLDSTTLMPSSEAGDYEPIIVGAGVSDEVDLVLIALAPNIYLGANRLKQILNRVNRSIDKPVVAIGLVDNGDLGVKGLPVFTFPEEAARVLGRHAQYGRWRAAHGDDDAVGPAGERAGTTVVDELLAGVDEARLNLTSPDLQRLLDELEIPLAPYGVAHGLDDLVEVADQIGYPVVMKAGNLTGRFVGESGGAAIDLHNRRSLIAAHERMSEQLGVGMNNAVVQRMVSGTNSVRMELRQDPSIGSIVSIGLGGPGFVGVPLLGRRLLPMDRDSAGELIDVLHTDGRIPPLDTPTQQALIDLVMALAAAAEKSDQLFSVSLNSILLAGSATVPVDLEIVLRANNPDVLAGLRNL